MRWFVLAVAVLGASEARAQGRCLDALQWEGEPLVIASVDAALREGPLADAPATACRNVRVRVERGEEIRFEVQQRGTSTEHAAKEADQVASWIESWLVPVGATSVRASVDAQHARPSHGVTVIEEPSVTLAPVTAPARSLPIRVDLLLLADMDRVGPVWIGGEGAFSIGVGRAGWLGFALGGQAAPFRDGELRHALRISVRAGPAWQMGRMTGRLGFGLGLASAHARARVSALETRRDEEAAVFLEGAIDARLPISTRVGLVGGLLLRANLPDEVRETPDAQPDTDSALDPRPLPSLSLTLRFGLSWGSGG